LLFVIIASGFLYAGCENNKDNKMKERENYLGKIVSASDAIDKHIEDLLAQLDIAVKKNPEGVIYQEKAQALIDIASEFVQKVKGMRGDINKAENVKRSNTDVQAVVQKYLIEDGNADKLMAWIAEYGIKMKAVFSGEKMTEQDSARFSSYLSLNELGFSNSANVQNKDSYGEYIFDQMHSASVKVLLERYLTDAKNSAAAGIDILILKASGKEMLPDEFEVKVIRDRRK